MVGRLIALNASPWLWVETTWAVVLCTLALVLRLVVRGHEHGLEDMLLVFAFMFAVSSFGCIYQALHGGLGISNQGLVEEQSLRIARLVIDSSCLCFVADGFSKLSTVAMLYKILCRGTMRDKKYIAAFVGASCFIVVWMISAAAGWASACSQPHATDTHHLLVCGHDVKGLEAILVLSILIELFIFLSSSYLFCQLKMKLEYKVTVITIFGLRLPLVLTSGYFLAAFKHYIAAGSSPSIVYGSALYWQIALVGYSILATAIQPLKRAATSFSTHTKIPIDDASRSSRSGNTLKLRSLSKTRQSSYLTEAAPPPPPPMIWSDAQAGDQIEDSDSVGSRESQSHIVKKRDVQVTYSDDRSG